MMLNRSEGVFLNSNPLSQRAPRDEPRPRGHMHDCDDREQDLEEKIEIPDWSMAQYLILIWTMSVTYRG